MTKERRRELKDIVMSLYGVGVKEEYCIAIEECVDKVYEAEKYAWHDLQKNPEDLPKDMKGIYLIIVRNFSCPLTAEGLWIRNRLNNVIAWREIEPFEEDNE